MAYGGTNLTSEEVLNIKCCVCREEDLTSEAEKYCVECKDYYCISCVDIHKNVPSLREHKLLDKIDFSNLGPERSLTSFPTQRCILHQSELVNTYCKDHDEGVCNLCVAISHRSCVNLHSISTDIDHLHNNIEVINVKQKLEERIETLKAVIKTTEMKFETLTRSMEEAEDAVKRLRKEIEALLDELEQRTLSEMRAEFNKIAQSLRRHIEEMESMIESLDGARDNVDKAVGNRSQEFVMVKKSEKEIAKAENMQKERNQQHHNNIIFICNEQVKENLQPFKTLGKLFIPKNTLYQVKTTEVISATLSCDIFTCQLYGSCIVDDDSLLLTDIMNKKLKRVVLSTNNIKDYLDLPDGPIAVCQVSKTEAAVTLQNRTVGFISLGDKMAVTRSLQMDHHCCGVAYTGGMIFISDGKKRVYVYDTNGNELKRISTDAAGRDIFQGTRHISVSPGGDQIFVADCDKGLVILDNEGNYISSLDSEKAGRCNVACTDGRNIFVCYYGSGKILQLSPNYTLVGEVGGFTKPLSVAFDFVRNRLLVNRDCTNQITVLRLE